MRLFLVGDLEEVNSWRRQRHIHPLVPDLLSTTGLIEPGICAGWMFKTDSCVAWLEEFNANPQASKEDRAWALDKLTDALVDLARAAGMKVVVAWTHQTAIMHRAKAHGFTVHSQSRTLLSKKLV